MGKFIQSIKGTPFEKNPTRAEAAVGIAAAIGMAAFCVVFEFLKYQ